MSKPAQKQADPPPTVLGGLRILVGRTRHQASALSAGLHASGAEIIEIPFIEVRPPRSYRPLDSALKKLSEYDWLILTSVNGVDAFFERLRKLRVSKSGLHNLKLAAIGPATKHAIEQQGLKVDVVPQDYIAESVVKSLRRCIGGKRVLLARARIARDVIPRELRKMGAHIDVVEAYQTVIPESSRRHLRAALEDPNRRPHVVTFTSSSSVRNFLTLLGGQKTSSRAQLLDEIRFASIGPVTSATLRDSGLTPHIEAKEYTIPGLIRAIQRSVSKEARRSTQLLVD